MSWLWAAVAGMVVYLDTTAVAQIMICQPIIACPVWGWIAGRLDVGILFGIIFQLLWSGSLPVGASKFPEGNVGALTATALAVNAASVGGNELPWLALTLAILIGVVIAYAGAEVTALVRRLMVGYAPRVTAAAEAGDNVRFSFLFAGAVGIHALAGLLLTAAGLLAGNIVLKIVNGGAAPELFRGVWPIMLGAGAAVVVSRFAKRGRLRWFLGALALGLGGGWLWL
jgi:mannose/fructose/N-acetylgalactosamine-specific phosphotransferase system component IIC